MGVEHSSCRSLSDNISYPIQSLVKQSFLCNFSHFSSLVLPTSTPPQTTIFSVLNLYADNLSYLFQSLDRESYLCNFSPFGFYFNEKKFQVHDCQLLLFNYVVTIQVQVIANNFILVLYQLKVFIFLFSYFFSFWKSSDKQVPYKIFREITT